MSSLKTFIYRGNLVESLHEVNCYIGSIRGEKIFSTNNEKDLFTVTYEVIYAIAWNNFIKIHKK